MNYSRSGTATLGSDYTLSGTPGKVTSLEGKLRALLPSTLRQIKRSRKKTAIMTLQSGAGYKLGKSKTATVTIAP